jgi:hypothetical protein
MGIQSRIWAVGEKTTGRSAVDGAEERGITCRGDSGKRASLLIVTAKEE